MQRLYKICDRSDWDACRRDGVLPMSAADRRDGFVHLSAAHQVHETAAKHFAGSRDLVLLTVVAARLPAGALRWEVSRGGDRFPHVYAALPCDAVEAAEPVPLGPDGIPVLPRELRAPAEPSRRP